MSGTTHSKISLLFLPTIPSWFSIRSPDEMSLQKLSVYEAYTFFSMKFFIPLFSFFFFFFTDE